MGSPFDKCYSIWGSKPPVPTNDETDERRREPSCGVVASRNEITAEQESKGGCSGNAEGRRSPREAGEALACDKCGSCGGCDAV